VATTLHNKKVNGIKNKWTDIEMVLKDISKGQTNYGDNGCHKIVRKQI